MLKMLRPGLITSLWKAAYHSNQTITCHFSHCYWKHSVGEGTFGQLFTEGLDWLKLSLIKSETNKPSLNYLFLLNCKCKQHNRRWKPFFKPFSPYLLKPFFEVEVQVGISRINFSKNVWDVNIVTRWRKYILQKYFFRNCFGKTVIYFCLFSNFS